MGNVLQNLMAVLLHKLEDKDDSIIQTIQQDYDLYEIRQHANQSSDNSDDGLTHLITVKDRTREEARKSIEQIIEMAKTGQPDWFTILRDQMTERAFQEVIESVAASKESAKQQSEEIIGTEEDVSDKFSDSYPKYGIRIVPKNSNGAKCKIELYDRFDRTKKAHEIQFGDRNAESLYLYFILHPRNDIDNMNILAEWYTIHSIVFPPCPSWEREYMKNPDVVGNQVLADIWKQSLSNANKKIKDILKNLNYLDRSEYYIINTCKNPDNSRRKLYSLNLPKELIDCSWLEFLVSGKVNYTPRQIPI